MKLEDLLSYEAKGVSLGSITQPLRSFGVSRSFTDPNSDTRSLHYGEIFKRGVEAYDGIPYSGLVPKSPDNLEVGDVVFADTAEDYGHVGISTYVKKPVKNLTAGTHTQALRPDQSRLVPAFLAAYTYTAAWKEHMRKYSTGNTVIAISRTALEKVEIPLPSIEIQNQIVDILDAHSELAELQAERVKLLKLEKDVLLEKIFSPGGGFKFSIGGKSFDTAEWETYGFQDRFIPFSSSGGVGNRNLGDTGKYPVISQSQRSIDGYTDDGEPVLATFEDPVIIFGDHTTLVKFSERPFVVGGPGVKLFTVCDGDARFFYEALRQNGPVPNGYRRHFSMLNACSFIAPSVKDQQLISGYFREIDSRIKLEEERLQLLKTQNAVVLETIFSK